MDAGRFLFSEEIVVPKMPSMGLSGLFAPVKRLKTMDLALFDHPAMTERALHGINR
jgi:hypothetical protein